MRIFAFWDSGRERAPPTVQRCLDLWERLNPQHSLRLLDLPAARVELAAYPEWIFDLPIQTLSDILRVHLLARSGGLWVDATVLPSAPLDDWLPPLLQPAGFFAFSRPAPHRRFENWLMAADAGTVLIRRLHAEVERYWDRPRQLSDATRFFVRQPALRRRMEDALTRPGLARWNRRYFRDPFWALGPQGRRSRYYPYFWFQLLTQYLEDHDDVSRAEMANVPFWPVSIPVLIQTTRRSRGITDAEMAKAVAWFFAASPVHKLDWRFEWPACLFAHDANGGIAGGVHPRPARWPPEALVV